MKQCTLEPECSRGKTHCCSECDLEEDVYCICPSVEDGANGTCEFLKEEK